ncbi:MAG: aspartate-semialdehyde dehydrogenase [Chloroflexi bacterium]|nr:MAG: aspartate-semialdehyde dehydrogenase [Chloroflexota bacterium]
MRSRIPTGILGATGLVGQRFIQLLDNHPWFEVVALTGSYRSVGKPYGEACRWVLDTPMPDWARNQIIQPSDPGTVTPARLVLSALPSQQARDLEPLFAQANLTVCSNASAFRQEADVPLLLPEVNPEHTALIGYQQKLRGWDGCIVTNPNCTSTGLTVALKALHDSIGVVRVFAVSLQALSGAGYPGVPSADIIDNVIPFIEGEEEKVELEPRKMLGKLHGSEVSPAPITISAHTNRVPVIDGHVVCASVELSHLVTKQEAAEIFREYQTPEISRCLPSALPLPIIVMDESDRPQPRRDRMLGRGMATVVGRLRPDPLFHLKFTVLSHNTIRGAAGGSIYNAELLVQQELLQ